MRLAPRASVRVGESFDARSSGKAPIVPKAAIDVEGFSVHVDPERYRKAKNIFLEAWDLPLADQDAFVCQACTDDDGLLAEVRALLRFQTISSGGGAPDVSLGTGAPALPDVFEGWITGEGPAALSKTLAEDSLLDGKYRIRTLLGAGGMGVVYKATQLALNRPVALKVLSRTLADSDSGNARFEHEALALARLKHPNIIAIYDFGITHDIGAYFVMELLHGRSLGEEIRRAGRIDPARVLQLFTQICEAVEAAHAAGVIHRDLKPDNIFLEGGEVETVKVLDFGIAKLHSALDPGDPGATQLGVILGTPQYMSPEQCHGLPLDEQSDVYSLGCVLYEMLTGRPPFTGQTAMTVLLKHLSDQPHPPSRYASDLGKSLDTVVLRALGKRPQSRYHSPVAFARALRDAVEGGAMPTHWPSSNPGHPESETAGDLSRTNLSPPLTSFVGRTMEMNELSGLLTAERCLVIAGSEGVGKTRLAIEVAIRDRDGFAAGVWFADLTDARDAAGVQSRIANALGLSGDARRDFYRSIAERLARGRALILLDGCDDAGDVAATVVEWMLDSAPHAVVLATVRDVERLPIGYDMVLAPLAIPDEGAPGNPRELASIDSVRLLVDRVRTLDPTFGLTSRNAAAVVDLSRSLGGLPREIERAAVHARQLPGYPAPPE